MTAREAIVPVDGFDYGGMAAENVRELETAAERIGERIKRTVESIIDLGRELTEIRDRVGHGRFGEWIATHALELKGISQRTVERWIAAAEWAQDKFDTVTKLEPTAVYALAAPSCPPAAQVKVLERIEAGEPMPVSTVKFMIAEARREEQAAKAEAKMTTAEKKKRAEHKARKDREAANRRAQCDAEEEARDAAADHVVEFLQRHLGGDLLAEFSKLIEHAGLCRIENRLRARAAERVKP